MKLALVLVVAVVLLPLAIAQQPALPTSLTGEVRDTSQTPVPNFAVTATWTTTGGSTQSRTVATLTAEQAAGFGTPELEGHYFFTEGFVQAASNTDITITSSAINSPSITSDPGGSLITVENLILPDPNDASQPEISNVFIDAEEGGLVVVAFTTNELAYGSVNFGEGAPSQSKQGSGLVQSHRIALPEVEPFKTYVYSVHATDIGGNVATDDNNGQYYTFQTGLLSSASSGGGTGSGGATEGSASGGSGTGIGDGSGSGSDSGIGEGLGEGTGGNEISNDPPLVPLEAPTDEEIAELQKLLESDDFFYGQLVDTDGNPVPNAEVVAEWVDALGFVHQATTTTLTRSQAEALGNTSLEGYYVFNSSAFADQQNITTTLSSDEEEIAQIESTEEGLEVIEGEESQPLLVPPSEKRNAAATITERTLTFTDTLPQIPIGIIASILISLLLLGIVIAWLYLTIHSFKHYTEKRKDAPQREFAKSIDTVLLQPVTAHMTKNIISVDKNQTMQSVAHLMTEKNVSSVVVSSEEVAIGILTEYDFSNDVVLKNMDPAKHTIAEATVHELVQIPHTATLLDAHKLMVQKDFRKLLVEKKGEFIGFLSQTDLSRAMTPFGTQIMIDSKTLPLIKDIMTKKVLTIDKNYSLYDIRKVMFQHEISCVILTSKGKPEGIITNKDYIAEIAINPHNLSKVRGLTIMKSPILSMDQTLTIFDANALLIEKNFRRLPILVNNELRGIVTQTDVVRAMYMYIEQTLRHVKTGAKVKVKEA